MRWKDVDLEFMATFYHVHSYALSAALSRILGPAQAAFMNKYAEALQEILAKEEDYSRLLSGRRAFIEVLKDKGLVEDVRVDEVGEGEMRVLVRGCALAPVIHPTLNLVGSRDYLCPIAMMAMVVLAKERGLKKGEDLFDYIMFGGRLSHLTSDGSETIFVIAKK